MCERVADRGMGKPGSKLGRGRERRRKRNGPLGKKLVDSIEDGREYESLLTAHPRGLNLRDEMRLGTREIESGISSPQPSGAPVPQG